MFTKLAGLVLALLSVQDAGVLRIRVVIDGTPMPHVVLLVSDNPSTSEPRRVRTGSDGTVDVKVTPGLYTVESDRPLAFGGKAYSWTQMVTVSGAAPTAVELTATNADLETAADTTTADTGSALLAQWQDSVVEIWTPTTHASGFVIDAGRGLIATSHHVLRDASAVEVELTSRGVRGKVAGVVVVSDRLTGAAMVRVNPSVLASTRPLEPGCENTSRPVPAFKDELTALAAPMFAPKSLSGGAVTRVTSQAIFSDMTLARDGAGSPVFLASGALAGIGAIDQRETPTRRWTDAWVVPVDQLCSVLATATTKAGAAPSATPLPMEPSATPRPRVSGSAASQNPQPPALSSANFDITLLTSVQVQSGAVGNGPRADFVNWTDYVRDVPPVLLIRISPQFEESLWKTLARGAAATQGMALPPLKSFSSNLLRLRAYCGEAEVAPIHPLIIERQIADKTSIREGLYVYPLDAFGTQCPSVRLAMYSEKDPQKADTKAIDPKLFEQAARGGVQ